MEPLDPISQQITAAIELELKKDHPELTLKVENLVLERGYIHSSRLSNWPNRKQPVDGYIGIYKRVQEKTVYVLFCSKKGTHLKLEKYAQTLLFPPSYLSIKYCEFTPTHPVSLKMAARVEKRFRKQWPFLTFKAESVWISIRRKNFHSSWLSKTYKGEEGVIMGLRGRFKFNNRLEKLHCDASGNHLAMVKISKINKYPEGIRAAIYNQQPITDETEVTSAKFNYGYWEVWVRCGTKEFYGLSDKNGNNISTGKDQLPMYLLV